MECLAKELAIFSPGIKVLLVEPGYFRTRAFNNINHVAPRVDIYSQFNAGAYFLFYLSTCHAGLSWCQGGPSGSSSSWPCCWLTVITGVQAFEQSVIGNEPGDSTKAVARMIELTKGTGMAAGKTVPLRVPLGTDGWSRIKGKCEETLKICEEWEDVAKSTDVQQG